jgi:hypothetical protein
LESDSLEILWDQLLSRQVDLIRLAFKSLSPESRQSVLTHLRRMVFEPGWHAEQRISAQAALDALADYPFEGTDSAV